MATLPLQSFAKLDQLKQAGMLTDQEYQDQKQKLIDFVIESASPTPLATQVSSHATLHVGSAAPTPDTGASMAMCAIHNKRRGITNMKRMPDGTYTCVLGSHCKTGLRTDAAYPAAEPATHAGKGMGHDSYGYRGAAGHPSNGYWPPYQSALVQGKGKGVSMPLNNPQSYEKVMCARHAKVRSINSMIAIGNYWVCKDHSMCKISASEKSVPSNRQFVCATHEKFRASSYLQRGPDGLLHCIPQKACKVSQKDNMTA
jgi:hypothetical protein|uniref:SHOCT domain-containing protein n=1 Tax=Eutreptiella gymnastica TaxID=73025 RepID=A0A7S4D4C6_9EUGL